MATHKVTRRDALVAGVGIVGALASLSFEREPAAAQVATPSNSGDIDALWENVEAALHQSGGVEASGVFLIELSRMDLHPQAFGIPLKPDFGFDTEITFQRLSGSGVSDTLMKYELVLLDSEVNPVLTELFNQNLMPANETLTALHNHWLELEPWIKYLHGSARGDAVQLATKLYAALKHSATPFNQPEPGIGTFHFNTDQVQHIIGGDSSRMNGVLTVDVPRKEKLSENGVPLAEGMQVDSAFMFQDIGNGQVAGMGEYVVMPDEADKVARVLRQAGIFVMALHNHELKIDPNVYYLHSFGTGDPIALAQAFRAALNQTNSLTH